MDKKRMLFVDDRTKRIHWALENYGKDYDVTIAACVPEALRLLSSQPWDVVSLDADLDGHEFQDPDEETHGMEIIRYITKCGGWPLQSFSYGRPEPQFWVHSSNIFAANLMVGCLKSIGIYHVSYKPVSQLESYKRA